MDDIHNVMHNVRHIVMYNIMHIIIIRCNVMLNETYDVSNDRANHFPHSSPKVVATFANKINHILPYIIRLHCLQ